ncbi:hypothetical protein EON80_02510 [bacterium]|nr:MAG: hypothetical protein EON80_02510 [bacterium]
MSPSSQRFWHRVLTWSGPLLLIFCASYQLAEWVSDRWWFESLGYASQFDRLFLWRLGSFALGAGVFAAWLSVNAQIAWRNAARMAVPLGFFETDPPNRFAPLQDKLFFDLYRRRLTIFIIALLSWLAGLGCAARYGVFLRALNFQPTGQTHSLSALDLGFFLFELPFWNWFSRFCLGSIIAALLLVISIYFYEELIGPAVRIKRIHGAMGKHLAVLWAALLFWKGFDCLLTIPNSYVGSGNVAARVFDVVDMRFGWSTAALFALLTPAVAIFSGVAISRQARLQTFVFGLGWMVFASTIPFLLPLVAGHDDADIQWQGAIKRHIQSTRTAWGLADVRREKIRVTESTALDGEKGTPSPNTAVPASLLPPQGALSVMNERLRSEDVLERVGGVWLNSSGSKLIYSGIITPKTRAAAKQWRARHLWSQNGRLLQIDAGASSDGGKPVFLTDTTVPLNFGSMQDSSLSANGIAGTTGSEAQQNPDVAVETTDSNWAIAPQSQGATGVAVRTWTQKLVLALRFLEPAFLRDSLESGDVVIWEREAAQRCSTLAPFMDWQSESEPVLVNDPSAPKRAVWLVSGLVWSDDYPDSAVPAAPGTAPTGANYGRQVALGVVDAKTGRTSLYSIDENEPFMALYRRAFPNLFAPATAIPNKVRENARPSQSILTAQSLIWGRYHQDDPTRWIPTPSNWRFLVESTERDDNCWRPFLGPGEESWQLMAYSTAQGNKNASGPASTLAAILGARQSDIIDRQGRTEFTEWRADPLLPMPPLVTNTSRPPAPEPWITVAPRFDEHEDVTGLLISRGDAEAAALKSGEPETRLKFELALIGNGNDKLRLATENADSSNSLLTSARRVWRELLDARRRGDWKGVGRAEGQLKRLLDPQPSLESPVEPKAPTR